MMLLTPLVLTLFCAGAARGYATGAPAEACGSLTPGHGAGPQVSPPPYDVIVEKGNLASGESTKITIRGKEDITFKGFLIQARPGKDSEPVGKFSVVGKEAKLMDCGQGKDNSVTHADSLDKKEVSVTWTPPANFKGEISFYVTIVEVYDRFWVAHKSESVTVS